ncbi:MAG: hypothetical protein AseanaTS_25860 [Candidatus Pelagadaptatus aseana]|uniref:hypothetical protein n=1 Tax=Candidatus Pelagadaptatus aseana TaxID=3120508 RepID=UPI0039B18E1E
MSDPKVDINQALLRIYAYYRTLLGCILLLAFYSGVAPYTFGQNDPDIFVKTAIVYTIINLFILVALWLGRFKSRTDRIFAMLLFDIGAIILAVHASGGMGNGLVFLLLVCVATGGILLPPQLSVVVASLASLRLPRLSTILTLAPVTPARCSRQALSASFCLPPLSPSIT